MYRNASCTAPASSCPACSGVYGPNGLLGEAASAATTPNNSSLDAGLTPSGQAQLQGSSSQEDPGLQPGTVPLTAAAAAGNRLELESWPFVGKLYVRDRFTCAAVLLSLRAALTAAHCVVGPDPTDEAVETTEAGRPDEQLHVPRRVAAGQPLAGSFSVEFGLERREGSVLLVHPGGLLAWLLGCCRLQASLFC